MTRCEGVVDFVSREAAVKVKCTPTSPGNFFEFKDSALKFRFTKIASAGC